MKDSIRFPIAARLFSAVLLALPGNSVFAASLRLACHTEYGKVEFNVTDKTIEKTTEFTEIEMPVKQFKQSFEVTLYQHTKNNGSNYVVMYKGFDDSTKHVSKGTLKILGLSGVLDKFVQYQVVAKDVYDVQVAETEHYTCKNVSD